MSPIAKVTPTINAEGQQDPVFAVFDAGRLMNQLGWFVTQYAVLRSEELRQECKRIFGELAAKAIEVGGDNESRRNLSTRVSELRDYVDSMVNSSDLAPYYRDALDAIAKQQHKRKETDQQAVREAYAKIIEVAAHITNGVRLNFERELKKRNDAATLTFFLGETVDQGLHPPGVIEQLFCRARNRDWAAFRHAHPSIPNWEAHPLAVPSEQKRSAAQAPPKFILEGTRRSAGELPPPAHWQETISAIWKQLCLGSTPPDSLFLEANRADRDQDLHVLERVAAVSKLAKLCKKALSTPDDEPDLDQKPLLPKEVKTGSAKKGKRIDERMLKSLLEDPSCIAWSARQWAERLKCSKSTVHGTTAWEK